MLLIQSIVIIVMEECKICTKAKLCMFFSTCILFGKFCIFCWCIFCLHFCILLHFVKIWRKMTKAKSLFCLWTTIVMIVTTLLDGMCACV